MKHPTPPLCSRLAGRQVGTPFKGACTSFQLFWHSQLGQLFHQSMAQYLQFFLDSSFWATNNGIASKFQGVFLTGTVCSTIRVTNGIKGFATQKTQAILSIRSDDGEHKIPAGFRWTRDNLSVLVSPVQNDSAELALIFLRGKASITVHVEDNCDLIFKNEACQDGLNVMVTSEAGNIISSGGKSSKIQSVVGNVTVREGSSFVPADLVDIYAKAGNISVFLQRCHVMLKSVSGNIRGGIHLSTWAATTSTYRTYQFKNCEWLGGYEGVGYPATATQQPLRVSERLHYFGTWTLRCCWVGS